MEGFSDDLMYLDEVLSALPTRLKFHTYYLKRCSSSQDVAEALALEGAPEGTVVVCEEMWRGRGRMQRKWFAGRGGLWFTVLLRPAELKSLPVLSLVAGLSVAKALKSVFLVDAEVKWPNDVLIDEKKVCGILSEARADGDKINYLLLGIGVNVNNELPEELRRSAVALKEVLGFEVPRVSLLKEILLNIDAYYCLINSGEVGRVIREWREWSSTLGRVVRVCVMNRVIEGVAIDVNEDGALLLKTSRGVEKVMVGDVVYLRTLEERSEV
jgi:BirA family biotin operon repressor/biotin-[acetyl-CoA-carboxylase] ligase